MKYRFDDFWLTETLRLREALWGPLEDAAESGRARAQGEDFSARVLIRARLIAAREGLDTALTRWRQIARLAGVLFIAGAVLTGIAAANAALGDGSRPVNIALALATLLGLNAVTFVFWLASFWIPGSGAGSLLAEAWLKLTKRLARGPDAALLPRALLELLARCQLTRWSAGVISHGLWALAMMSALVALLVLLSARRYHFQWETTLLSPDVFVSLVHGLGALPAMLGFPHPDAELVRNSGDARNLPEFAHALWSSWLLGVVAVYGLLPRTAALLTSWVIVKRRAARLDVDPALPGITELHERLMPPSVAAGIDAPAPSVIPATPSGNRIQASDTLRCMVGIELPRDIAWPPADLPPGIGDCGVVDTREERHRLLEALRLRPAQRLLACCDARQTPDRGTLALLSELASLAGGMQVALVPNTDAATRRSQWRQQLLQGGFAPEQLPASVSAGLEWLGAEEPIAPGQGNGA